MKLRALVLAALGVLALPAITHNVDLYAQDWDAVQIETTELGSGLYMFTGRGGNLVVSVGEDGVFLVDDQYAPLSEKIIAAIRELSDAPIRFVINTHWHGDHTGGNENMGKAGALLVAHENVRKRMSVEQFIEAFDSRVEPSPKGALPVVTFTRDLAFHLNGQEIRAFHIANAHTDGDAIVVFSEANVVHPGDTFFNNMYPFIDVSSGGSIAGMIEAANEVLGMIDDQTQVVPGHGVLSDKAGLEAYRDMLIGVQAAVAEQIAMGKDQDAVVAAKPTAKWDDVWGKGFLNPDVFTGILYDDLSRGN
jgi:glyoxylase-like metal-dependent hydrolase (beta-lactamase superfamily II)